MQTGLAGKSALITGGSSGIGLGIAQVLAEEGVRLAIASRNPDPAALEELRKAGAEVYAISARRFRLANVSAAEQPAGPAPIINTSYPSIRIPPGYLSLF